MEFKVSGCQVEIMAPVLATGAPGGGRPGGTAAGSKEREGVTHRGADRSGPSTKGCPSRCLHGKTF